MWELSWYDLVNLASPKASQLTCKKNIDDEIEGKKWKWLKKSWPNFLSSSSLKLNYVGVVPTWPIQPDMSGDKLNDCEKKSEDEIKKKKNDEIDKEKKHFNLASYLVKFKIKPCGSWSDLIQLTRLV